MDNKTGAGHQLQALALLIGVVAVTLQILYLSQSFDAYQLVQHADGLGWRAVFGYLGKVAKLVVVFVFLLGVSIHHKLPRYWKALLEAFHFFRFTAYFALHLILFVPIFLLSKAIFTSEDLALVTTSTLVAWLALIFLWLGVGLLAFAPLQTILKFIHRERQVLCIVTCLACVVWFVAGLSSSLWGGMSVYTFNLSVWLLSAIEGANVYVDVGANVLGLEAFAVNIAPACSGYEGIGLVCSFTALYLYVHRSEFNFPQALLLFPIGALFIWLLNVVRIVALILIGEHWSAEVAVGGFHSQAGWLTFIFASLSLLWAASSVAFFSNTKVKTAIPVTTKQDVGGGLAIACLVPMVVLLGVILVSSTLSAGFDWLYPIRVIAVVLALFWVWPKLAGSVSIRLIPASLFSKKGLESTCIGVLVAVLWWALLSGLGEKQDQLISETLAANSSAIVVIWLLFRFLGSAITVPIAEELAFRAYILCKLCSVPVSLNSKLPISVLAVVVSSLAFGFLHGAWVAGTVAGLLYALVRYRSGHVGYAIFAHGVTNAGLFVYAFITGEWSML